MSLALVVIGALLLVVPGLAGRWLRRLPPRDWAGLATASLLGGLVALETGLVTLATPTVLRSVGWSGLARACDRMFRSLAIGGPALGWSAAGAAIVVTVGAGWGVIRARRLHRAAHVDAWLGDHRRREDHELVLLPAQEPVAYSLPGHRPQIVISEGLSHVLTDDQLRAVLRHEHAHLRLHHSRHLLLAAAIDRAVGAVPGIRRSTTSLRVGLERWADEEAAGTGDEDRRSLQDALVAIARATAAPGLAAFEGVHATVDRVEALAAPPRSISMAHRALAWGGLAIVWVAGMSALGLWIGRTGAVLAMAGYCT
jgi:hypothetical protein